MLNSRKVFTAYIIILSAVFLGVCEAAPLAKESEEYKQLEAMGCDISVTKIGDESTVAKCGGATVYINKAADGSSFSRLFSRKPLSEEDELKLLRVVNQMNIDLSTQVALTKTGIIFATYNRGPHNAKAFAAHIRVIEKTDQMWADYPTLLPLLNK